MIPVAGDEGSRAPMTSDFLASSTAFKVTQPQLTKTRKVDTP
jgi:hypothetical protein